jgi:hypothetical protein
MKNLLSKAAKLFVVALMIFTLAPTKIVAEGTSATAISSDNATAVLTLYKDENHTQVIPADTQVKRTDTIYAKIAIDFKKDPTSNTLDYLYSFPKNISVVNHGTKNDPKPIKDQEDKVAGTFYITDNILYFTYDAAWVADHPNDVRANFSFDFKMNNNKSKDTTSSTYSFPGVTKDVTIKYDDGYNNSWKS